MKSSFYRASRPADVARSLWGASTVLALICAFALAFPLSRLDAQTGGEAGIQGTVTDPTGSAIPNATITATNAATKVATTRQSTGAGLYTISPIIPGVYTVTATAQGFSQFKQENLRIDALRLTGLNITLHDRCSVD